MRMLDRHVEAASSALGEVALGCRDRAGEGAA
jgi:hypothetical protein